MPADPNSGLLNDSRLYSAMSRFKADPAIII